MPGERISGTVLTLGLLLASPVAAQTSPYVGEQERRIKALAPEREQGLRTGAGLGYAMAAELTRRLGQLEGRLRFVHLRAHLETDSLLTEAQRRRYVELRGYDAPAGGHGGHAGHGAPSHGATGGS